MGSTSRACEKFTLCIRFTPLTHPQLTQQQPTLSSPSQSLRNGCLDMLGQIGVDGYTTDKHGLVDACTHDVLLVKRTLRRGKEVLKPFS